MTASVAHPEPSGDSLPLAYLLHQKPGAGTSSFGIDMSMKLNDAARPLGYHVDRIELRDGARGKSLLDGLHEDGYAGILVGPSRLNELTALIDDQRFCIVQVQRIDPLPYHTVRFSITVDIRQAWRQMSERGYRRIGAAIPFHDPPIEDDFDRRGVILNELAELPESEYVPPFTGKFSDFTGLSTWLKEHRPDAILSFFPHYYFALREYGIDPHNFGWAMLHLNTPKLQALGFCGMMQDEEELAKQSIRLMDQLIRQNEYGAPDKPVNLLVSGNWVEGKSLPGPGKKYPRLQEI